MILEPGGENDCDADCENKEEGNGLKEEKSMYRALALIRQRS